VKTEPMQPSPPISRAERIAAAVLVVLLAWMAVMWAKQDMFSGRTLVALFKGTLDGLRILMGANLGAAYGLTRFDMLCHSIRDGLFLTSLVGLLVLPLLALARILDHRRWVRSRLVWWLT
jgi:hypothetical protein